MKKDCVFSFLAGGLVTLGATMFFNSRLRNEMCDCLEEKTDVLEKSMDKMKKQQNNSK